MKKLSYKLYVLTLILSISCKEQPKETTSPIDEQEQVQAQLDHGKYMVDVLGCTDCHTPKKMTAQGPVHDMDRFLMGFDASQPLPPVPDNVPIGPWCFLQVTSRPL